MTLWIDADACPGDIKDLILRAARRVRIRAVFVANKFISLPESPHFIAVRIGMDPEAVDEYIAQHAQSGDFAVSQDIPLASLLVPRGVVVLSPRGELFTDANIRERLSIRNFMHDIREAGGVTPGPKPFGRQDRQRFSDALDRELSRALRSKPA